MAVFVGGAGNLPPKIQVTITGKGDIDAYARINDTVYYDETSGITTKPGEIILLAVIGSDDGKGIITIDGLQVALEQTSVQATYDFVVPSGISRINIALSSYFANGGNSTITVTTS